MIKNEVFNNLVAEVKNRNTALETWFNNLSTKEKDELKKTILKYKTPRDFALLSTLEESNLFPATLNNPLNHYLTLVKYLDTKYIYDKNVLTALIIEKVSFGREAKGLRQLLTCDEVWITVYVAELNNRLGAGYNLDYADRAATIAANWAKIGCRMK